MRHPTLPILPFILIILLAGTSRLQALVPNIETEATATEGQAKVVIRVFGEDGELKGMSAGAEVWLNRRLLGYAPLTIEALAPGNYLLEIEAEGYLPQELSLGFQEKTSYKIGFTLVRRTGILSLTADPPDAQVRIDGKSGMAGIQSLPTGRHRVELSRFGYVSRAYTIEIGEGVAAILQAKLELAPFELGPLSSSRPSFDPRNAAAFGSAPLAFSVSSWGSGRLDILDASGQTVASWDFPLFDTWNQRLSWRGRDSGGLPLPDGPYRAELVAWPRSPGQDQGGEEGKTSSSLDLLIDSRLALSPFGAAGAVLGLLHFPEPGRIAPGTSILGLGFQAGSRTLSGETDLGFETAWAHSFGRASLAASVGFGGPRTGTGSSSGNAALGMAWALREPASPFSAALTGRLAWLGEGDSEASWTRADLASGIGLEGGIALGLALGPIHLGLDPGLRLALPLGSGSSALEVAPLLRAGLWYGSHSLRAGLSALGAPASFPAITDTGLPLSLAAELHWIPSTAPFALGATLCADLAPGAEANFALLLGLDFLF